MSSQRQLDEFTQKLDVAQWYMGVSKQQEDTIFSMHERLRDDFEQETGTTMFNALVSLGIQPVIAPRQLKRIVQLSRNNILAFLFFLLEGYYKTCRKGDDYSINEQLLMIAIAKIDLLPTLRGLDAILPAPTLHPLELRRLNRAAHAQLNAQVHSTTSPVATAAPAKKPSTKSPYFQSQPRPVQRLSKLSTETPDFVVDFNFWPRNGTPNYGEEGDMPWYAQYKLNPGMRLIKKTLSETLERYFKLGSVEGEGEKDEDGAKRREPETNMCLVHKAQVVQAQLLRDELTVKARDRCLELLDISQPQSRLRKARIVAQLEHDIDLIMDQHRRAMKCDQTKVLAIEKADCVLCQKMLVSQPRPEPDDTVGRALVGEECGMAHTAALDNYCGKRLEGGGGKPKKKPKDKGKKDKKGKKGKKAKEAPPEPSPEKPKRIVPTWEPPPRKLHNEPFRITNIDFKEKLKKCIQAPLSECEVPPAPKKSAVSFAMAAGKIQKKSQKCEMPAAMKGRNKKKFFKAARSNQPYQFKYHRVFQSGLSRPFDMKRIVTKTFVKALKKPKSEDPEEQLMLSEIHTEDEVPPASDATEPAKESEPVKEPEPEMLTKPFDEEHSEGDSRDSMDRSSNHSRRSHVDHKAEIVEAVVRCANIIWQKQVAIKRAKMEREERLTQLNSLVFKEDEKFDPDDDEQMKKMLKDGLRVLRQDPRYVLATLPNAHKLPVMREWVKRRYGKAYSKEELEASLVESTRIFELVTMVQSNIPPVDLKGLDRLSGNQENFDNYEQIKKTGTAVKKDYHTELNDRYLSTMGAAWYAMGNYLVPGGPPRTTFFAYIASNPQEIMRAKTWNGDYRNYRAMRDRRKEAERAMGKTDD